MNEKAQWIYKEIKEHIDQTNLDKVIMSNHEALKKMKNDKNITITNFGKHVLSTFMPLSYEKCGQWFRKFISECLFVLW